MEQENDPIIAKLLRRPAPPTAFQTEAFVARVMSRLPAENAGFLGWLTPRVLAPALGLGLAALAFSFSPYARDAGVSPAASLIASGPDRSMPEWLTPSTPGASELVGVEEDR